MIKCTSLNKLIVIILKIDQRASNRHDNYQWFKMADVYKPVINKRRESCESRKEQVDVDVVPQLDE